MAKMVEIRYMSEIKELQKLNERLEKREKALEKAQAKAEKLGVADMTADEHREWLKGAPTTEDGWITDKEVIKKNGAWFDLRRAIDDIKEIENSIQRAEARLEKKQEEVEKYREEVRNLASLKEKEELLKLEFEQEQKEWAKDGIKLERRYAGETPKGKRFRIDRNNGYTERSWHCYTLTIDRQTIFTSGEFWRAYGVIKNN